jgi:hypothetical protein
MSPNNYYSKIFSMLSFFELGFYQNIGKTTLTNKKNLKITSKGATIYKLSAFI